MAIGTIVFNDNELTTSEVCDDLEQFDLVIVELAEVLTVSSERAVTDSDSVVRLSVCVRARCERTDALGSRTVSRCKCIGVPGKCKGANRHRLVSIG